MTYIREAPFNEEDFPTLKLIKDDYRIYSKLLQGTNSPARSYRHSRTVCRCDPHQGRRAVAPVKRIRLSRLFRSESKHLLRHRTLRNHSHAQAPGTEPEQIALDHVSTDLPIVEKALLNFTLKLNNHPLKITQDDRRPENLWFQRSADFGSGDVCWPRDVGELRRVWSWHHP